MLDNKGDREPDYWITDMDPITGTFVKIAEVLNTDNGARVMLEIALTIYLETVFLVFKKTVC